VKILVINLDSAKDRLAFQKQQMKRLSLEFERLPATTIQDIDLGDLSTLQTQWERPMRSSEIACLYSHRSAWRIVAEGNQPVLILEDDALLSSKVPAILKSLENSNSLDHATLEIRGRKKILAKNSQPLNKYTDITRLYQDRTGAAAYVLWPRGANILLKHSDHAAGLADAIIAAAYELSSWQVEPAAAMQLDQCDAYGIKTLLKTASSIGSNANDKPSPANAISAVKYKWRRIISQLRMGLHQLSTIAKANRRLVEVEIDDFRVHIND